MHIFFALVHKDADSTYGVTFPDLPGCFSASDTLEGIVPAAAEALDLWFETEPAAPPATAEAVRAAVAEDLAAGAFLVAVPYVRKSTRQVRVNISMDAGTLGAIDSAAGAMKLTRSAFLAMAAANEIRGTNR